MYRKLLVVALSLLVGWHSYEGEVNVYRYSPSSVDTTIYKNESVRFNVGADASRGLSFFEWYFDSSFKERYNTSKYYDEDSWVRSFNEVGVYTVEAYAYDEEGSEEFVYWNINVVNRSPVISRSGPTSSDVSIQAGDKITFSVDASDEDGDLDYFEWYLDEDFVEKNSADGSSESESWALTFDQSGTYEVGAYIYDEEEAEDFVIWEVTVNPPPNNEPSVSRVSPSSKEITIDAGDVITFESEGTDQDGDLDFFEWNLDDDFQVHHDASGSFQTDTWTREFESIGTYEVSSLVYDKHSEVKSIEWTVNVEKPSISSEFFDDFSYTNRQELESYGWSIRRYDGGPGYEGASWKEKNITFIDDPSDADNRLLKLSAETEGTVSSTSQAQINTPRQFLHGTYATKIRFIDDPISGSVEDGVVHAYFTTSPQDKYDFSEVDFEYYPNGPSGNEEPWKDFVIHKNEEDKRLYRKKDGGYNDNWHILLFRAIDNKVKFYEGGKFIEPSYEYAESFYPDDEMGIYFQLWFVDWGDGGLKPTSSFREYSFEVDWVYHAENVALSTETVKSIVSDFRAKGTERTPQVLPVELASFRANQNDNATARLTWKTTSETKNSGFAVQHRSSSVEDWKEFGFVQSKATGGTSTSEHSYRFTTDELEPGTHHFRLKQVDLDGSATRTDPVSIKVSMEEGVRLTSPAPNPVSQKATVSFAVKEKKETTISLYNVLGQKVRTLYQGTPTAEESRNLQVYTEGLSSGVYMLRLVSGGQTEIRRMTVVK